MKSKKWNESGNNNTEKDWLFSWSCWRWLSRLWTIETSVTSTSWSHFRLDWKHCKLQRSCIQAAGHKEEAKEISFLLFFFFAQTSPDKPKSVTHTWTDLFYFTLSTQWDALGDKPVSNHCKLSLTTQAVIKAAERVPFCLWMWWILTWQATVSSSGRQRRWTWCSSLERNWCLKQRNTQHMWLKSWFQCKARKSLIGNMSRLQWRSYIPLMNKKKCSYTTTCPDKRQKKKTTACLAFC